MEKETFEGQLLRLFEEYVKDIDSEQPADNSWGSGSMWMEGSLNNIARRVTLFGFMKWLKER